MRNYIFFVMIFGTSILITQGQQTDPVQSSGGWKIHDMNRPRPPVISPGTQSSKNQVGLPPSDAIILFDSKNLSAWEQTNGEPAKWKIEKDYMEVVRGRSIRTKQAFGDCQLHIEWSSPISEGKIGQQNGNSGVFMMGLYEIQVLNSYQNKTYPDGQAAAIYGQYPPLVNCSRPSGEWQSYDIIFRRPRFQRNGMLLKPARITLLHNGILVHDNVTPTGPTAWQNRPPYEAHPDKMPIMLQDHDDPVRYRNIWIRELETYDKLAHEIQPTPETEMNLDQNTLNKYVGKYQVSPRFHFFIKKENNTLVFYRGGQRFYSIFPKTERMFFSKTVGATVEFSFDNSGAVEGFTYTLEYDKTSAKRVPDESE